MCSEIEGTLRDLMFNGARKLIHFLVEKSLGH